MHEAPVIETLHFKLSKIYDRGDIQVWIRAVGKRRVRELIMEIDKTRLTLPRSLFTCCRMLVSLKLKNMVLQDHVSSPISFPYLKRLGLKFIKYPSDGFFKRILSGCPILEDLFVVQSPDDNLSILSVRVPSLKRLVLGTSAEKFRYDAHGHGYVIDAPSLECLDIADYWRGSCVIENNMTMIVRANLVVDYWDPWKNFMGSIISAKRLYLCVPTSKCHDIRPHEPRPCWNETNLVPEYLLSSLETFKWVDYEGTKAEKEVAAFILRIASCLKKATIIPSKSITDHNKKLEMLKDFPKSSRRSPACHLAFKRS